MSRRLLATVRPALVAILFGAVLAPPLLREPAGADPLPTAIPCNAGSPPLPLTQPIADPLVVSAGFEGAPAYYEFGFPLDPQPWWDPVGYMIVVHGGGWYEHGALKVQQMRREADVWRRRGWATLNISYRPCAQSIADVFWFYEQLRQRTGPDAAICATGASAGGHLVLLLAGIFGDLDCAISQAGPIDLLDLPDQLAYDDVVDDDGDSPPTGPFQSAWPRWVYAIAAGAFGVPPDLYYASPRSWAGGVGARVLVATAASDLVIPLDQGRAYAAAVLATSPSGYVDVHELPVPPPGVPTTVFVHGAVTSAAMEAYRARELALVAPLVGG